jgi:hypothetical protein
MEHSSKPRKNIGKRPLGMLRGEIWIAPDFDVPMKLVDDYEAMAPTSESPHRKKDKVRRQVKKSVKRNRK